MNDNRYHVRILSRVQHNKICLIMIISLHSVMNVRWLAFSWPIVLRLIILSRTIVLLHIKCEFKGRQTGLYD